MEGRRKKGRREKKGRKRKKRRGGSEMCSVVEHMSCETPWVESTTPEIIFQKEEEGPE